MMIAIFYPVVFALFSLSSYLIVRIFFPDALVDSDILMNWRFAVFSFFLLVLFIWIDAKVAANKFYRLSRFFWRIGASIFIPFGYLTGAIMRNAPADSAFDWYSAFFLSHFQNMLNGWRLNFEHYLHRLEWGPHESSGWSYVPDDRFFIANVAIAFCVFLSLAMTWFLNKRKSTRKLYF